MKNCMYKTLPISTFSNESKQEEPILISFRELVTDIDDTGYLTHSIHYYPAKFIPQVVRYCLIKYTEENDLIVDPFAGSGTVGLEAYLCKRNSFLLDINPMLNHIIPLKIYTDNEKLSKPLLSTLLDETVKNNTQFIPKWEKIDYWYPDETLEVLMKYWGYQKKLDESIYSLIIEASLLKISKHFSYAEHKLPKLFRSKSKRRYIDEILQDDWLNLMNKMLYELAYNYLERINQFIDETKSNNNYVIHHGGVDSSYYAVEDNVEFDGLITSPPYLQAQEYIRTSKLDMYWLGYDTKEIRQFSKLEIPYRKPTRIIETKTLNEIRNKLERKDLIKTLDSYFCHTINGLENPMNKLKKGSRAMIFVGNPQIGEHTVEIWKILKEYFVGKGFTFEGIFEDEIKHRQLFRSRKNKNPRGMKSEYLLVLKR